MARENDDRESASDFGKRLLICIAKAGASQSELARRVGYSAGDISKHISGERGVNPKTVARYIEAFRDMGLEVVEQFFYVPWEYLAFYDPKRTDVKSARGGR